MATPHDQRPLEPTGPPPTPSRWAEALRSAWMVFILVPFGWLAWASFLWVGVRARRAQWVVAGVVYLVVTLAALITLGLDGDGPDDGPEDWPDAVGTITSFVMWGVAFIHAMLIRRPYIELMDLREAGAGRRRAREMGHDLVREDPALARELGVGRPDLPHARHCDLVDLNHASAEAVAALPGVDADLARRIVEVREEIDGFSSLEDLGTVLDLPARLVERLRGRAVFIAR